MSAIASVIDRFPGRQADLARQLGVSPQAVNQWVKGRRPVPVRLALVIERVTGVSRHELRPDVFGEVAEETSSDQLIGEQTESSRTAIAADVDSRMSKRALRARLGFTNDKQLATVLGLPLAQVESWEEERALPAVPEVLRLLGVQAQAIAEAPPADPDDGRIVSVEVA
ncbi:transcriptional regulator [Stenotrophomonas pigmentata]|uniref:transcriptional regulator n=1 Tax=Stenotrophomonas pigmentata TaxID=3055080 RepID=UPI0026F253ED|nr:Cro/CI family transcriptional regulator [Stenotrophomonas sp. 610A2]